MTNLGLEQVAGSVPGGGTGLCQTAKVTSRLVVLGSCGAWPEPGRACSGFVLEHGGTRIVLDLGYGTLPRLPLG
jgi:hypothetical protein